MAVADILQGGYLCSFIDLNICHQEHEVWPRILDHRKFCGASHEPTKNEVDMAADTEASLLTCDSVGSSSHSSINFRTTFKRTTTNNSHSNMKMTFVKGSNLTISDKSETSSCSSTNYSSRCRSSDDFNTNIWNAAHVAGHTGWRASDFISFCTDLMTNAVRSTAVICDNSFSSSNCCKSNSSSDGSNTSSNSGYGNRFVVESSDSCSSGSDGCGSNGGCHSKFVRNKRTCQLVLHYSDVIVCALIVCLLLGVCSATCQNSNNTSNCSSGSGTLGIQTQTHSNLSSSEVSASLHKKTDSRNVTLDSKTDSTSYRQNHSVGVTSPSQDLVPQSPVLKAGEMVNSGRAGSENVAKDGIRDPAYLSATNLAPTQHEEERDDNFTNIISLVIPFVLVIILALVLCVTWKLCQRYKCCNNEACLQKCSAFCNNCMSTPYVFQVPGNIKPQGQISRDSTGLTLISQHRHTTVSYAYRTTGSIVRQPQSKSNVPRRSHGSTSSGSSRQGSSRSGSQGVGYSPVARQNLVQAQSAGQHLGQAIVAKQTT